MSSLFERLRLSANRHRPVSASQAHSHRRKHTGFQPPIGKHVLEIDMGRETSASNAHRGTFCGFSFSSPRFPGLYPEHLTFLEMTLHGLREALWLTYEDIGKNHTLQMAAALSYYFVLSLFPALIFLSAVVAYLPVPDLFNQALALLARFLPADAMGLVRRVLADVVSPNKGTFLSLGILSTLWAASGGFAAMIEALNIAYDVSDDRPFWKTRP